MERVDANLVPFAQNNPSGYRFAFGTDTATDDINVNYNDNIKKGWGTTPNEFPEVEDFNAMVYTIGYLLSYLYHMGIAEWNDKQKYRQYSRVIGSDGIIYKAKTGTDISPNVNNDPTIDTTNWEIDNQFNINSLDNKITPIDTDNLVIQETGGLLKKLSWANLKATLKNYFDTLYATPSYVDSKMVLGTAISITGSTSVDFTGIPISAKRVTVMLDEVSSNGSSLIQIQIGNTSISTSGYFCTGFTTSGSNIGTTPFASGFVIGNSSQAPTMKVSGFITIDLFGGNIYVANGMVGTNTTVSHNTAGSKNLGSTLNMLRVTTVNGTDTFDAGSINITYEG